EIMLLGVYRGVANDKMAFAYSVDCDNLVGSFHRCRNLERSVSSGLGRATNLQSMGRLQLRGSEDLAESAQGYGAQRRLRSLPRLQMSGCVSRQRFFHTLLPLLRP